MVIVFDAFETDLPLYTVISEPPIWRGGNAALYGLVGEGFQNFEAVADVDIE